MYRELDYYALDELYTEDERMARDTARDFVSREVIGDIGRHFADGTFPTDLIGRFGELGLLGTAIEGYDCPGMSATTYGLIAQELERADSGIRSFCSVQSSLVMWPIWAYGSEEQKRRYLPAMTTGEVIGCFGLTEPDFGSNPAGMLTVATETERGYSITGTKRWITNGSIAHVALVWAKLDGVVRGFLVPTDAAGFEARDIDYKWSLRASVTSELILDEVEVDRDAILPEVAGLKGPLSCLTQARFGICFGAVGSMQACYDEARRYALDRVQFSRPIAGYQLVQAKLAQMVSEITKAQLLCYRLGRLKEAGALRPQQVSLAKRNNVYWMREIARTARDILGGNGITHDYQCGRHMLNAETVYTYEGTHDIHTLIVGHDVTGLAAFDG